MERIKQLMELLSADPEDSFLLHALALEYIKLGDDTEARRLFEKLLQKDPGYVGSYYHLAKLLQRNNDLHAAAEWYRKGIEVARTSGDNHALNELRIAYEEMVE